MDVFWTLGYEGAKLTDLQTAMGGITAPSFYAAYGSKEQLFREAVELYSSTLGAPMIAALAEQPTARAAIAGLLEAAAAAFSKPGKPRGCMLVVAAMNSAPDATTVRDYLHSLRTRRRRLILERLARGVRAGELPSGVDPSSLASFYSTLMDGLAIQARDGAPRSALNLTVRCAMASWDTAVAEARKGRGR
jgi:AcrR family transcriptional regulator